MCFIHRYALKDSKYNDHFIEFRVVNFDELKKCHHVFTYPIFIPYF